jgi:hypothetical protein
MQCPYPHLWNSLVGSWEAFLNHKGTSITPYIEVCIQDFWTPFMSKNILEIQENLVVSCLVCRLA